MQNFSLKALSEFLADYYGKKVIILLDEYDTPMQEAFVYGYWDLNHLELPLPHANMRFPSALRKWKCLPPWTNTSSNSLVEKLIQEGIPEIKIVMEDLLQGKSFHASIDE